MSALTIVVAGVSALSHKRPRWLTKIAFGMDAYHDVSVKSAQRRLWQNCLYQFVLAGMWFGTVTAICARWLSVLWERLEFNVNFSQVQVDRLLLDLKIVEAFQKFTHVIHLGKVQRQLQLLVQLMSQLQEPLQHDLMLFFFCTVVFAVSITICTLGVGIRFCQAVCALVVSCASLVAYLVVVHERQSDTTLLIEMAIGFAVVVFMISWLCRLRDLELRREFLTNDSSETWLGR